MLTSQVDFFNRGFNYSLCFYFLVGNRAEGLISGFYHLSLFFAFILAKILCLMWMSVRQLSDCFLFLLFIVILIKLWFWFVWKNGNIQLFIKISSRSNLRSLLGFFIYIFLQIFWEFTHAASFEFKRWLWEVFPVFGESFLHSGVHVLRQQVSANASLLISTELTSVFPPFCGFKIFFSD